MSKKQIVRIAGIGSAVIFAMGALFPFVSMEFFGTKMSKSLINTSDGIFFILDAVLFAVTMFLSEKISLYICAATAVILTIADTQSFFGSNTAELSDVVTKGFGFYCVIIGVVLMVASAVANIVVQRSNNSGHSENVKKSDTRKCPFCAETIKADAVLCRFCGSRLEPLPDSAPAQESSAETHSAAPKSRGRRALTVILIIISAVIFVISTIGMIVTISDQPQKPDTEEVQPAETEVTTTATTTTTAATTPEPEETASDDIIFMSQTGYDMVEPEIKAYISINYTTKCFYFGSSDYYKIQEYCGSWEYVNGPRGYDTLLCTIKADEHGEDMGDKYQFILNISWDDPDTAYFTLNCDYDYDVFGYTYDGTPFQIYR